MWCSGIVELHTFRHNTELSVTDAFFGELLLGGRTLSPGHIAPGQYPRDTTFPRHSALDS